MHLRTRVVVTAGLAALAFAISVIAAVPTFWRLESQTDFLSGDTDGVSISSDGVIALAPATSVLTESTEPHFWSLAIDGSGQVYAGSGNDGKIYRIDAGGQESVIADTNELQVHALAVDRRGNLYAGTSPRGVVYRIDTAGSQEVFFDPDDRYIWALVVDSSGNLIVATGDKAQIHRITPSGESEVLFTSEESHIISLAIDSDDNIFAGTESNGLVLKIDRGGATSVLFDTPFQEVRALVLDTRGNVFAATVNGGGRATPAPATSPTTPSTTTTTTAGEPTVTVTTSATAMVSSTPTPRFASPSSMKGGLFRIAPDGSGEQLWQSGEDTPLSLALGRDDRLLVGTGNEGRVFLVHQDKTSSLLLSVEADQVTAIRSAPSGQAFLATSNPAKLYRVNAGRRTEGAYQSAAKDTGTMSSWGRIQWEARTPSGTAVEIQTRSGNSAEPDNTWSDWSRAHLTSDGEQIASPRARFLQWRAVLKSTGELSPELLDVTAIYLQQNLPPEVSKIVVHPPGKTFQKPIVADRPGRDSRHERLTRRGSPDADER